jgi:cytochrome c oxidase subunit 4
MDTTGEKMAAEATHTVTKAGAHGEAHQGHNAPYMLIWGILLVLTLAEVGYSYAFQNTLPKTLFIVGLIVMAVWKAVLVALYYMHLRWEPRRLWVLTVAPLPLIAILILAVLMEY